jgi:hypothetical protein
MPLAHQVPGAGRRFLVIVPIDLGLLTVENCASADPTAEVVPVPVAEVGEQRPRTSRHSHLAAWLGVHAAGTRRSKKRAARLRHSMFVRDATKAGFPQSLSEQESHWAGR